VLPSWPPAVDSVSVSPCNVILAASLHKTRRAPLLYIFVSKRRVLLPLRVRLRCLASGTTRLRALFRARVLCPRRGVIRRPPFACFKRHSSIWRPWDPRILRTRAGQRRKKKQESKSIAATRPTFLSTADSCTAPHQRDLHCCNCGPSTVYFAGLRLTALNACRRLAHATWKPSVAHQICLCTFFRTSLPPLATPLPVLCGVNIYRKTRPFWTTRMTRSRQ
jgi:hypothetical protein